MIVSTFKARVKIFPIFWLVFLFVFLIWRNQERSGVSCTYAVICSYTEICPSLRRHLMFKVKLDKVTEMTQLCGFTSEFHHLHCPAIWYLTPTHFYFFSLSLLPVFLLPFLFLPRSLSSCDHIDLQSPANLFPPSYLLLINIMSSLSPPPFYIPHPKSSYPEQVSACAHFWCGWVLLVWF